MYWVFKQSGQLIVNVKVQVDYLLGAGGGSSGFNDTCGGGAGGIVLYGSENISNDLYTITIGQGGKYIGETVGSNGGHSEIFGIRALGGGGGGASSAGNDGGNGGGGGASFLGGIGLQGYDGGDGSGLSGGGGGGGVAGDGQNGVPMVDEVKGRGGDGGIGIYIQDIFPQILLVTDIGLPIYLDDGIGGGGGGGCHNSVGVRGGYASHGGTPGWVGFNDNPERHCKPNTCGGGGGGRGSGDASDGKGSQGGSGLCIIRYKYK